MGSTLGPNSGPRAGVILTHPNSFPMWQVNMKFCLANFIVEQILWLHRKKLASVGPANQVFFVVTKSAGTATTASASGRLAARTVTQIKVLVSLNHCISLGVFLYDI
jgi:hypothetical protein